MVEQLAMAGGSIGNSMVGGYFERKRAEDAARALRQGVEEGQVFLGEDYDTQRGIYDPYAQVGAPALQAYQEDDFETEVNPFEFLGTTQEYLDPSMDFQKQEALKAMQQSASASGGLYSGAAMQALQDRSQDYAMQDYGNAFNRMQQDRNNKYQEYTDNFKMRQQNNATRAAQLQNLIQTGQWGANGQSAASQAYNTGMAGLSTQSANINAARANVPSAFENFATSAMGQLPGVVQAVNTSPQITPQTAQAPMGTNITPQMQMDGASPSYWQAQQGAPAAAQQFGTGGNLNLSGF